MDKQHKRKSALHFAKKFREELELNFKPWSNSERIRDIGDTAESMKKLFNYVRAEKDLLIRCLRLTLKIIGRPSLDAPGDPKIFNTYLWNHALKLYDELIKIQEVEAKPVFLRLAQEYRDLFISNFHCVYKEDEQPIQSLRDQIEEVFLKSGPVSRENFLLIILEAMGRPQKGELEDIKNLNYQLYQEAFRLLRDLEAVIPKK